MRDRRFRPTLTDTAPPLERRDNPGPLLGGWWTVPQSYITLTDSNGVNYPINKPSDLIDGLNQIKATGALIDTLFIKGHGDDDLIYLDDTMSVLLVYNPATNKILYGTDDVTDLFKAVTGSATTIGLTGCDTGALAVGLSKALPNVFVEGQLLPYAIGVPWTPIAFGWNTLYINGAPAE